MSKSKGKPYLKTVQTRLAPALDLDSGEIYSTEDKTQIVIESNKGFTMWLHNLDSVMNALTQLCDVKLLYWIGRNLKFNESIIVLNGVTKSKIEADLKMSPAGINRGIKSLKNNNVIRSVPDAPRSGVFIINPSFIWHGSNNEREIHLKDFLKVEQEENQRKKLPDFELKKLNDLKAYKKTFYPTLK